MARLAYCTGCGVIFDKMHLMINHRRHRRCGGRFLPVSERIEWNKAHDHWMLWRSRGNPEDYTAYRYAAVRAILLRKQRLKDELKSFPKSG